MSGAGSQLIRKVGADAQGNYYFGGEFENKAIFPNDTRDAGGGRVHAFLGSLTGSGAPRWLLDMGSLNELRLDALAVLPSSLIASLGYTNRFQVAGLDVEDASNGGLAVLAFGLDSRGDWAWVVHNAPNTALDPITGRGLSPRSDGSVTLAGDHTQSLTSGALSLDAPSGPGPFGFVTRIGSNGGAQSLKPLGLHQHWNAAVTLTDGFAAVGEELTSQGSDILLGWFDQDGNISNLKRFGGDGDDAALTVERGEGDSIYVSGYVSSPTSLGAEVLPHAGLKDVFVASYAADGSYRWSKTFGSASDDWGVALRTTNTGQLVLTGVQGDKLDIGIGPVGSFTNAFFLAAFAGDGSPAWAQTFAMNAGEVTDLAVLPDGAVTVVGFWDGALKLPGTTLASRTGRDGFLIELTTK